MITAHHLSSTAIIEESNYYCHKDWVKHLVPTLYFFSKIKTSLSLKPWEATSYTSQLFAAWLIVWDFYFLFFCGCRGVFLLISGLWSSFFYTSRWVPGPGVKLDMENWTDPCNPLRLELKNMLLRWKQLLWAHFCVLGVALLVPFTWSRWKRNGILKM